MSAATIERARPCTTRDPRWWDTFNAGNAKAIKLCNTACPFKDLCEQDNTQAIGVIRAGIAYDDDGLPVVACSVCGHPRRRVDPVNEQCEPCVRKAVAAEAARVKAASEPARPSDHHDAIVRMLTDVDLRCTYRDVSQALGIPASSIETYWHKHKRRLGLTRPKVRLSREEVVTRWSEMTAAGMSAPRIAQRLGISGSALNAQLSRSRVLGDPRVPVADPAKQRRAKAVRAA